MAVSSVIHTTSHRCLFSTTRYAPIFTVDCQELDLKQAEQWTLRLLGVMNDMDKQTFVLRKQSYRLESFGCLSRWYYRGIAQW